MRQYCLNALAVAEYLEQSPHVGNVIYPWLESNRYYELARKYLSGGSGVVSFVIKGGRRQAEKFIDALRLVSNEVHVADIRTCVLHPASESHRQLSNAQLAACGISPGMIRLSIGLENVDDILLDLQQAFARLK
jgi:O-acetylhomoserine (thiol)-lyase